MQISIELAGIVGIIITLIAQGFYIAFTMGKFSEKLIELEKKQDKHNNLIERTVRVEDSTKSAHNRLDSTNERLNLMEQNCQENMRKRMGA